ncbi:endonuclease VIII [Oculatella sp. FACHB-28]|uniref:endonuclease VIII n=1 Tax=Oculatella sp. FACHB-28 TaxID=2692845 RepID=UPI001685A4F3|nr:endonuclease VIII [Oculatella sp. FACHB-28]MBD2060392.1 endonuclease VIII [Oculatella sp. FACHB-28]
MPEGPEIKQAADQIAKAIGDRPVTEIFFAFERLKPYEPKLVDRRVVSVTAKGKAMLIGFDNQLSIYSHNQLYGKWVIRAAHAYPATNRQLRLAIHNEKKSALLYSASDIEVLTEPEILIHPFLSKLGLDVLDEATTVEQAIARLHDKRFYRRSFISLLLDQGFFCGLGNYLRSEVLFVAKIHPTRRPTDCSSEQIAALAEAVLSVSRQSYQTGGITNGLKRVAQLKAQGQKRNEYRHYVFNRADEPCYICGTAIVKEFSGGRRYYYCPTCQPCD